MLESPSKGLRVQFRNGSRTEKKKINNTKCIFKEIQGVREMVQLVERLTCKHEDPSSIPQTNVKMLGIVACPGEPETQIPGTAGQLTYSVL